MPDRTLVRSAEFRIALTCAVAGLGWIMLVDRATSWLGILNQDGFLPEAAKGALFVVVFATLVYRLVRREITSQEREEGKLRLLEACLARINDGVIVTEAEPLDEPGPRIVFVNDAFVRQTGYTRAEAVGRSPRFLLKKEASHEALSLIREAMTRGEPVRVEQWNSAKDGREYRIELDIAPVTGADGRITHVVSVQRDITERKRAEEALHDRTARLSGILTAAADAIVTIDETGVIDSVNPATERMFGYPAAELLGRNVSVLMPAPYRDEHDRYMARYAASGVKRVIGAGREVVGRRKDGTIFPVDLSVSEVADGQRWFTGIVRDVSDRKRAEANIREQAELLDKVTNAVIVRALDGRVTYWNRAAEQLYGWTAAEVSGRPPSDTDHSAGADDGAVREALLAAGRWDGERLRVTKAGRVVVVMSYQSLLRAADGAPSGVIAIDIDMTERKQLEQRLLRAQRLESIGALASGIAHDLNNVLTPVRLAIKLLLKDRPGLDKTAILETADASVERGAAMIRQLLTFGGGMTGDRGAVSVADLVREVRGMMEHTLPKSIVVRTDVPGDVWRVTGDPTQLTQVLVNLCVNARDAMPDGGTIDIRAANVVLDARRVAVQPGATAGRYVVLSVADTGHGISSEVQEKMFDPFFTTKPFGQGTGLGLATLQGIVKSHNGFVNVYSEPGKGAKFTVHLPAAEDDSTSARPSERPAAADGHGELIVVADDEPHLLDMAATALRQAGYRVATARNGDEAVEVFRRHRGEVAAVVLDMMMPGTGGAAAIPRLRALDPCVRVVAVSGLQPAGADAAVLAASGAVFVSKPYSDDDLLIAVHRALTSSS